MPKTRRTRAAPAPYPSASKASSARKPATVNPLIEKRPRNFAIGGDIQPKRDLSRFVKWPRYVRLQRQRAVLYKRLKVPPAINQFTQALDRQTAKNFFRLAHKYRPETKQQKRDRLKTAAEKKAEGQEESPSKKPIVLKYGINHVTSLIEQKKAQLVAIAHDVDPIEIVIWVPALCRKMQVPYCVVKGKARLGQLVHKKTATAVALTAVKNEDRHSLNQLIESVKSNYNDRADEIRRHWGGGVMGGKTKARLAKMEKAKQREAAKK
jgi:large subunit ribosomal protein L7Ae